MCQELVEGRERTACVQRAIQESRASYLCAESRLRVARKQVVCQEPFESPEQASCEKTDSSGSRAGYLCAHGKHAVRQELVKG